MKAPPPRVPDRVVLSRFGIDRSDVLGEGGEATVYALDADRVLRLPRADVPVAALEARRRLIDRIRARAPFALPEVLEHVDVGGRTIVIERRLPGRDALWVLGEPGTDREALVRSHLDAAAAIAELPCPTHAFGEIWGPNSLADESFGAWATARLAASLRVAGERFADVDATNTTRDLLSNLREPAPPAPMLVHLDAYLGNMLADGHRITAVLDFGPMAIGGPADLDPLAAIAYLAPEITPTANDADRAVARAWAAERGLLDALAPAERWLAAYWTFATDDLELQRWCARILGAT